ncbi:hypothetical protein GH714_040560 [Hevea brasiliensis]|uniref:Nucleoside diphosphate kinase n=1 Tax=Hevea brasiliensis TaxID=3981 RepID=A0A6A6KW21_HEVBR|nr:hypothetical protein GH714_040560 [Hevea brasiliensis]
MKEAAVAIINAEEGGNDDESTDGMRLVQLLITCAEAVAYRDKSHASALLSELRSSVLVFGSSFQRVASCFVQGIANRLSLVQPLGIVGFIAPMMNIMDISCDKKEETLRFVYEIFPHIQFQTIGDELMKYAKDLGINLEFWMLESNLENLRPDDIKLSKTQATMDRSSWEDLWNSVLQMIHALSPKVLVLVEQDSSHNGPFFLGRFMEALHYYSAIFDSLDAMLPRLSLSGNHIIIWKLDLRIKCLSKVGSPYHNTNEFANLHLVVGAAAAVVGGLGASGVKREVEETYIMVKPDGVQRGLVGEIISRFEKKGFKLTGLKLFQCPKELAEEHYKDLKSRPFFPKLINYITSGPVVCMAWEGVGVVASARKLIGSTDPLQAEPGTRRVSVQTGRNVVHGSDSPENGKREIGLWFKEGDYVSGYQLKHLG